MSRKQRRAARAWSSPVWEPLSAPAMPAMLGNSGGRRSDDHGRSQDRQCRPCLGQRDGNVAGRAGCGYAAGPTELEKAQAAAAAAATDAMTAAGNADTAATAAETARENAATLQTGETSSGLATKAREHGRQGGYRVHGRQGGIRCCRGGRQCNGCGQGHRSWPIMPATRPRPPKRRRASMARPRWMPRKPS